METNTAKDQMEEPLSPQSADGEGDCEGGEEDVIFFEPQTGGRSRPPLDHLEDGTHTLDDGSIIPLFDVGSRVVVERMILWDPDKWLDTRVGKVTRIDDETGVFRVLDEEDTMYFHFAFNDPSTCTVKLAPEKGNPFELPGGGVGRRKRRQRTKGRR